MTRFFSILLIFCFLSGCALTQDDVPLSPRVQVLLEEFPVGSIDSISEADAALAAVAYENKILQYQFGLDMDACTDRFLVNYCYEKTQLRYMKDKAAIKPISVEADRFKRSERVRLRDQALVNAQQNEILKEDERAASRRRYQEKNAKYRAKQEENADSEEYIRSKVGSEDSAPQLKKGAYTVPRASKLKNPDTTLTPEERQANIEKFEQKQQEAIEKQAEVERKKAETQAKRDRHAASRGKVERKQKVASD